MYVRMYVCIYTYIHRKRTETKSAVCMYVFMYIMHISLTYLSALNPIWTIVHEHTYTLTHRGIHTYIYHACTTHVTVTLFDLSYMNIHTHSHTHRHTYITHLSASLKSLFDLSYMNIHTHSHTDIHTYISHLSASLKSLFDPSYMNIHTHSHTHRHTYIYLSLICEPEISV